MCIRDRCSIDSTDLGPEHWLMMAKAVQENYALYDGFIICHGTDTPVSYTHLDVYKRQPQNGSFTSGFARGRCVVTAKATNPALVCAWLDQMYAPLQSPQNNWGT